MFKIQTRYLLAALPFVSTEETRYYLTGVHFETHKDGVIVVATDGHVAFAALDNTGSAPSESAIYPLTKELLAACKAQRHDGSDRYALIDGKQWQVGVYRDDVFDPLAIGMIEPIDGTFPDWRRIVPNGMTGSAGGVTFNPNLMVRFEKAAKALGVNGCTFLLNGPTDPALVGFGTSVKAFGVLMPMRGPIGEDPAGWLRKPKAKAKPKKAAKAA